MAEWLILGTVILFGSVMWGQLADLKVQLIGLSVQLTDLNNALAEISNKDNFETSRKADEIIVLLTHIEDATNKMAPTYSS